MCSISVCMLLSMHILSMWTTCTYCVRVYVLYKPYVFVFSEYYLSVPIVRSVHIFIVCYVRIMCV